MKPKLVTPPASEPLTLLDVKEHLRVWFDDDDDYISDLIKAVVSHLDGYSGTLNRCLVSQTWQTSHRQFCRKMETLFTDTTAVIVKYYDANGDLQTVDDTNYTVYPDYIKFKSAFAVPALNSDRDDAVHLLSTHGYSAVPESLLLAMKMLIAHWYRNREPVTFNAVANKVPHTINSLFLPHRWAF